MHKTMAKKIFLAGSDISNYTVVVSKNARDIDKKAVELFISCVKEITGTELSLSDDSRHFECEIIIGSTERDNDTTRAKISQLKGDGIFIYFESEKRLFVTGEGYFGVMNAVCSLLEKFGYRFCDEKTTGIIGDEDIYLDRDLEIFYSPILSYRKTDWQLSHDMKLKLGLNGELTEDNAIIGFAHTIGRLSETENSSQPCLSDEGIYQTVLKNVRNVIAEHPECRIISVTQNDNFNYCKCEKCSSLAEHEGQSGVLLNFINRLAADIEADHPDVNILTFAYQYTRKPPTTIKPRHNVIIWLCSIECCFSHPLNDGDCKHNKAFAADIVEWGKICNKIIIWDYTTNYAFYVSPFPNFKTLLPNARFFVEHGAMGIYEEGDYQQTENGEFRSLRAYLIGKILWNPYMSYEEYSKHIDDFLLCYYGKGAEYVREYIDRCCALAEKMHLSIYTRPEYIFMNDNDECDLPLLMELDSLWQKAIAAADTDAHRINCRNSSVQSKYMLARARALLRGTTDPDENLALINAMKEAGIIYHFERGDAGRVDRLDANMPIESWNAY